MAAAPSPPSADVAKKKKKRSGGNLVEDDGTATYNAYIHTYYIIHTYHKETRRQFKHHYLTGEPSLREIPRRPSPPSYNGEWFAVAMY